VNFFRLWSARADYSYQDGSITKDSHICFAWGRPGETARASALRNDVILAQQSAVEAAADEIIGNNPS
jgi:hypothetical protein